MAAPPSYSHLSPDDTTDSTQLAPDYSQSYKFTIGRSNTTPFVNIDQLKAHLSLLHSFHNLRLKAEATNFVQVPLTPEDSLKTRRWAFFVSYAVERFQAWSCSPQMATLDEGELFLPPLDVLMVWHAYRLNPGWYAEDSSRLPGLSQIESIAGFLFSYLLTPTRPASSAHQRYQEQLLEEAAYDQLGDLPSIDRSEQWESLTDLPFDVFEGIAKWNEHIICCPYCHNSISAKLLNGDGTGYLQKIFTAQCAGCNKIFGNNALAVAKFTQNYTYSGESTAAFIAGTLHTPFTPIDKQKADSIKASIGKSSVFACPKGATTIEWENRIGDACKWDIGLLFLFAGQRMEFQDRNLLTRMQTAYRDDRPFSVDLVGATLRQSTFAEKMKKLGWSEPDCFKSAEDEIVLLRAIARYHMFLDLISSKPGSLYTPTLDIDLVWHTHQLFSSQYGRDTRKCVGRFIDHDDKVGNNALMDAFALACTDWEKRFGVKYSLCGCDASTKSVGDKISNRVSKMFGSKQTTPNDHLLPFNRLGHTSATHPSDHNGIITPGCKPVKEAGKNVDAFWGRPFVYPCATYEPADGVAAGEMIHAGQVFCWCRTHRNQDGMQVLVLSPNQ